MTIDRITSNISFSGGIKHINTDPLQIIEDKIQLKEQIEIHEISLLSKALINTQDINQKRKYASLLHSISNIQYDAKIHTPRFLLSQISNWGEAINCPDKEVASAIGKTIYNITQKYIGVLTSPTMGPFIELVKTLEKGMLSTESKDIVTPSILLLGTSKDLVPSPQLLNLLSIIWKDNLPKGILSVEMAPTLGNHLRCEWRLAEQTVVSNNKIVITKHPQIIKELLLSNLETILANKASAEITIRLLHNIRDIGIITLDEANLRHRLSTFSEHPNTPLAVKNNLLRFLGVKFDPLNGLRQSDTKLLSESISYLFIESANQKYQLTSQEEAQLIENSLTKLDQTAAIEDVKRVCYLICQAVHERKLLKNLKPNTINTLCNILVEPTIKPAMKQHICKSIDHLISMNSGDMLKTNSAGEIIHTLATLTQTLTSDSNEVSSSLLGCLASLATKANRLDQEALSKLTDAIILKLEILSEAALGAFDHILQYLNKVSSLVHLSTEPISHLIDIASNSTKFDSNQKSKILETLLNFRVNSLSTPSNLSVLLDNLEGKPDALSYLSLKVLNLFEPSEDLILKLRTKPLLLENIIINSANLTDVNNPLKVIEQEHKAHQLIKSEACMLLASVLRKGYTQPDEPNIIPAGVMIGDILHDKLSFTSEGELWLLKACIEIGNIDTTHSAESGGIVIAEPMAYHIANLIMDNNTDAHTLIAAIQTMTVAASYRADAGETLDFNYILDCLNAALMQGYNTDNEEIIEASEAAIHFLESRFKLESHLEELEEFIGSEASETIDATYDEMLEIPDSESDIVVESSYIDAPAPALIRTTEVLIAEIKQNNESIDASRLEQKFKAVSEAYETYKNYSKDEIKAWTKEKSKTAGVEETIAVVKRANFLHNNQELRDTQILSTLLLLEPENKGRLAEIKTGEGKSTTVAVLAIVHALKGKKVDVITSSHILASRDAEDKKELFETFGLSVGHNHDPDYVIGLKEVYEANIVYGEATAFQHDYLRHEYKDANTRGTRLFSETIGLVDEVDSMLLDESSKIAKIAGHTPGMEYLLPLMALIWKKAQEVESDPKDTQVASVKAYADALLSKDYTGPHKIILPTHLIEFVLSQTEMWAASTIRALNMKPDVDYVITTDEKGQEVIAPVDHENTGIVRAKTAWVDGLHQFLQMKHELVITSESLTTAFISNLSFFKSYGNNIYGLTGTLGSLESQQLLKKVYNVDTVKVPTYKPSQLKLHDAVALIDERSWIQEIIQEAEAELAKGRALLVICDTILAAKEIDAAFKKLFGEDVVKGYWRSDDELQKNVTEVIDSGEIIVATNLAGRGTDIHTTPELEVNGGLHIMLTFLPKNQRIEDQAFGRTARQGKNGSARLIINAEKEIKKIGSNFTGSRIPTIEEFRRTRDLLEREELARVTEKRIPKLELEDRLFKEFAIFKKDLWKKNGSEYLQANLDEMWGFWLKKNTSETPHLSLQAGVAAITLDSLPSKFEEFKKTATAKYTRPVNPFYLARHAHSIMASGKYAASFDIYRQAIALDPVYSFISSYNMGYAVVRENNVNSRIYNDGTRIDVMSYLEKALKAIDEVHIPQILKIKEILQPQEGTPLSRQIEAKHDILTYQKAYIEPALSTVRGMNPSGKVSIRGYNLVRDMFPKDDPVYRAAIQEVNASGLHVFYDLGVTVQPKRGSGLAMIASLATTALFAPVVGPWAMGFSNAFIGGAVGAAALGGASRTVGAIVERKGRLDKAFKDVTSRDSLRSIGLEAISAGVAQGVMDKLKIANLAEAKDVAARNIRIAQQHAIRGVVHSAVHQEKLIDSMKREAINAGTDIVLNTTAVATEAVGIKPTSFVRTAIDGTVAGGISHARGGKFEHGFAAGIAGNLSARFVTSGSSENSYRPDLSAPVTAAVVMATGGDEKAMVRSAAISSSVVQAGHILQVHAKAHELEMRAKMLAGVAGIAAGDSAEDTKSSLKEPDKPELSFAANRAEELIKLAKDYAKFAENYPRTAAALIPVVSIGIKAMVGTIVGGVTAGPGGALVGGTTSIAAGVVGEVQNWFTNELAGEQIAALVNVGIEKVSSACKSMDPTLTDEQAQALGAAAVLGGMGVIQSRGTAKEALKIMSKIRGGKIARADVHFMEGKSSGSKGIIDSVKPTFKWEVKPTKDADKIMRHQKFGKFYRDPTQKIGNSRLWWSKDQARHGGSVYKVFKENAKNLEHIADVDANGKFIPKNKGPIGDKIEWKELNGIK